MIALFGSHLLNCFLSGRDVVNAVEVYAVMLKVLKLVAVYLAPGYVKGL